MIPPSSSKGLQDISVNSAENNEQYIPLDPPAYSFTSNDRSAYIIEEEVELPVKNSRYQAPVYSFSNCQVTFITKQ